MLYSKIHLICNIKRNYQHQNKSLVVCQFVKLQCDIFKLCEITIFFTTVIIWSTEGNMSLSNCKNICVFYHTGNPTIKKCKKIRMQREEAQELADLDVSNILATKGNYLSLFGCYHLLLCPPVSWWKTVVM